MKKIVLILLIILTVSINSTTAIASTDNSLTDEIMESKVETTKWVYRTHNGKTQKRLWSINRNKWLTDWITCS